MTRQQPVAVQSYLVGRPWRIVTDDLLDAEKRLRATVEVQPIAVGDWAELEDGRLGEVCDIAGLRSCLKILPIERATGVKASAPVVIAAGSIKRLIPDGAPGVGHMARGFPAVPLCGAGSRSMTFKPHLIGCARCKALLQ